MRHFLLSLCVLALGCSSPAKADWPQWRGPDGTGAAPKANTVSSLNAETGENIKWATPLPGPTAATPIVIGDYAFTPAADMENFRLLACALDRNTGKILWTDDVGPARKSKERARENTHAECSPVADAETVYFLFGTGDLCAYTHAGQKKWRINISETVGNIDILWGYASSPLLLNGKLYVQVLRRQPNSLLICIDPATGKILWKHERPSNARAESLEAYTTPIACTLDGKPQVVVYGGDALTGHDPETGKELWRFDEDLNPQDSAMFRVISGPTQGLNGLIYFTTPRGNDLLAVEVKDSKPTLKWFHQDVKADVPCPVYADGFVYVLSGGKKDLYKFNADTGEQVWHSPLDTSSYLRCTPTVAGGNIYLIDGEGEFSIFSAGDKFELLSKVNLGGYPARATIAVAGDELFIRTGDRMICVGK